MLWPADGAADGHHVPSIQWDVRLPVDHTGRVHEADPVVCPQPVIGSGLRSGNSRAAYRKAWHLAPCRDGHPQRPGMPLYKPQVYQYRAGQRAQAIHVTQGQLLGQRAAGKFLRPHERPYKRQDRGLFLLWRCQSGRG